jgi:hypothetical protein
VDTTEIINAIKAWASPFLLVVIGGLARYIWSTTIKEFNSKIDSQDNKIAEITKKEAEERTKAFEILKELLDRENKLSQDTDRKHDEELKILEDLFQEGIKQERKFWQDVFTRIDKNIDDIYNKLDQNLSSINLTLTAINKDLEGLKGEIKTTNERIDGRTELCNERHSKS